jgi:hypothetical protein
VVLAEFESTAVAKAFRTLPERWQAVLWYVDIEGIKPAAASTFLGLTPNAVSALALRAREGRRRAYLQSHVSTSSDECKSYSDQLGALVRKALKRSSAEKVQVHLEICAKCTAVLADLDDVQGPMRAAIFPLVAGVSFKAVTSGLLSAGASEAAASVAGTAAKSLVGLSKLTAATMAVSVVAIAATVAVGSTWQTGDNVALGETTTDPAMTVPTRWLDPRCRIRLYPDSGPRKNHLRPTALIPPPRDPPLITCRWCLTQLALPH